MKAYGLTDIGAKREMNQDYIYVSVQPTGNLENLFIVADGMGGHNAGDVASRLTVETMVDFISESDMKSPVRLLRESVMSANRAVIEKASSDRACAGMGTTLVACTVSRGCLYIASVGDSRLYMVDDQIEQITRDHSLVQEMVQSGQITREEARVHPDKNVITRAIGMKSRLKVDLFDVDLAKKDRILLCSDGLSNMVEDRQILQIMNKNADPEKAAEELVEAANRNGGSDNISVIVIEPDECGV